MPSDETGLTAPQVAARWRRFAVVTVLALSAYGLVLAWAGQAALAQAGGALLSGKGVMAVALCLASYLLRGWRWRLWMARLGRDLAAGQALRWYLSGYAFTPTPANAGEALRGLLPRQAPLSLGDSVALFGAERVADLLALLLLALPTTLWLAYLALTGGMAVAAWGLPVTLALAVVLISAAVCLVGLIGWLVVTRRLPRFERLPWLEQAAGHLLHRPAHWLALTLLAWAAQGAAVGCLAAQAGLSAPAWQSASAYAMAMVVGAASFLPAGLGGTELVLALLLGALGATTAVALSLTVQVRLVTLWLAVALGAAALLYSVSWRRDLRLL